MIAIVETAEDDNLEQKSEPQRGWQREGEPEPEASGPGHEHRGEIGADHILDAMREVDEIHHPEHERQARGDQEQQQPQLQAVQDLNDQKRARHREYYFSGQSFP